MSRCNLQRVSVASSSRNTDNRSTLSVLCVKSVLASLVQAAADGSEQLKINDTIKSFIKGTTLEDSLLM